MSDIKLRVIEDYTAIANFASYYGSNMQRETICKSIYSEIAEQYTSTPGYLADADLGLGCGFPFNYIQIKEGFIAVDLGCAAGIDSFILSKLVGNKGYVYGFDITPKLIERAQNIALIHQVNNVKFICADIENLPVENSSVDVITSNGVLSLLPNKLLVFKEMFRVLKKGGYFSLSDIAIKGTLTAKVQSAVNAFTGCLNGISNASFYMDSLKTAGFLDVVEVQERVVEIPTEIIMQYSALGEQIDLTNSNNGVYIITIRGFKP